MIERFAAFGQKKGTEDVNHNPLSLSYSLSLPHFAHSGISLLHIHRIILPHFGNENAFLFC